MDAFETHQWEQWVQSQARQAEAMKAQQEAAAVVAVSEGEALRQVKELKRQREAQVAAALGRSSARSRNLRDDIEDLQEESEREQYRRDHQNDAPEPVPGSRASGSSTTDRATAPSSVVGRQFPATSQRTARATVRPKLQVTRGAADGHVDRHWKESRGWEVLGTVHRVGYPPGSVRHTMGALVRARATGTYYQVNGNAVSALNQRDVRAALLGEGR